MMSTEFAYEELANAIVFRAVRDYQHALIKLHLMSVIFPLMIKTFDGTVNQKEMEKHLENIEKIVESELMD